MIRFLKSYANLTDEELAEVNGELSQTWRKIMGILKVDPSELDPTQVNADYMYWLCFTVGLFRENRFMVDTFGDRDLRKTMELLEKMKRYRMYG